MTVKFTDKQLESGNLKKTFLKCALYYHSDKKNSTNPADKWDGDKERQEYLRDEIIKITNKLMEENKGFGATDGGT